MVMLLSVGNVWAAEVTYSLTPDATSTGSSATSYQASLSFTYEGVSWTMAQINPSTLQTKTNQSSATAEFNFHNTSAFPGKITKVVITYSALTLKDETNTGFMFVGGSSAVTATTGGTAATWNGTNKTMTWEPASTDNFTFFAFYMDGKRATGSNYLAESDAIVVTYETSGGGTDPVAVTGVTLDQSEAEIAVGGTVTLTPTVSPSNATTKTVTWESSDDAVATVDGGVVTGVAEGTATITVKTTDGNKTATCEVTVTAAPAASNWQVTDPTDLVTGDVVVLTMLKNNVYYAAPNNGGTSAPSATVVAVANSKLSNVPAETLQWTVTVVEDGVYQFSVGNNYLKCTDTNNGVKVGTGDYNTFDVVVENEKSYLHTTETMTSATSGRYLGIYNTQDWRCYGSVNNNIKDGSLVIFREPASSKENAGLAYATEDAQKLVKVGAEFTAPTLSNDNNLTVTYTSDNTSVAEVDASTGVVTLKNAAGKAVITASSEETTVYKAGSASYTIYVAEQAGTAEDPLTEASAKALIDLGCTLNAHVAGTIKTPAYYSTSQTYTVTLTADFQFYKLKDLGNQLFTSNYLKANDQLVVLGPLGKHNTTYQLGDGCYIVNYEEYTAPLTPIANDKDNPYTVAQALAYAAEPATYDLSDHVYIQGEVYKVNSFDADNGTYNIYIKDAGTSENDGKFEFYKCSGLYQVGETAVPFEEGDVQVGNIVIGYGVMTYYSQNSIWEFGQPNQLVELQKPVTGIELDATAEVEEGQNVNLTATILPSNATGTIVWSVESGDAYASVDGGVVTGIAEGEAVIRATVQGTTFYAECTVTVNAAVVPGTYDYALVTDAAQLQDGLKVIIVAANEDKAAGSAAATYRNVVDVERTTGGNYLILDTENMPTEFTLGVPAAGQYTFNDGDGYMYESAAKSVKVQADPFNWSITIGEGNIATIQATNELRYNSGSPRFTTYASGQQALQLYVKDDGKQPAGLAWSTDAVELTVGDEFTAPTLTNTHELTVTIASNNPELATVEGGVVSLVENATGTAIITASYAGDDTYRAASVSYTITVNAATPTPAETKNVVILAEYNSKFYAMTNSLSSGALAGVEVEKDGSKIVVSSAEDKAAIQWTATVDGDNTTLKDAENNYIKGSNGASLSLDAAPYNWNWDGEKSCYISSAYTTRGLFFSNSGNVFKGYALSNITSDGYAATEVIEIDPEDIVISSKVDPALAYTPASDEITVGDAWSAPVLGYATGFDGLAVIEYGSNNESVATVTEGGEISLAGGYGTAVITATFGGNTNYLAGSATYTITVNAPAPTPTGTIYRKVTATEDITDGEYLIVYEGDATHDAAVFDGSLDNDNIDVAKKVLPVAIVNNEIAGNTELDAAVFTIDVTAGSLQSASGYYIGKADYANGMDKSTTEAYVNTFAITDGEAVIKGAGNCTLRYNYASDQLRFRYYKSGQQAIQLYKKETATPVDPTPDYTRTVVVNRYGTICLPNGGTIEGAKLYDIDYYDGTSTLYLLEVNGNAMVAGRPYIFLPSATSLEVFYTDDADEDAGTYRGLVGSYSEKTILVNDGNYILYKNAYYLVNSAARVGENRAYIHMESVPTTPYQQQGAPRRRVAMNVYSEQTTTDIDALNASEAPVKMIIDGQLFIIRGEKMYNVNGQVVK